MKVPFNVRLVENRSDNVGTMMLQVLLALIPGTLVFAWFFGPGVIVNIVFCCSAALLVEAAVLKLRSKAILSTLSDNTALVTAWLFALTLPPQMPWWVLLSGTLAALLLGKHLYGGIGNNPFNPAMLGYAFVIICFPREVTAWIAPAGLGETVQSTAKNAAEQYGLWEAIHSVFNSSANAGSKWDAVTMATPLDRLKHGGFSTLSQGAFGAFAWDWINLAWLCGGLWMLYRRIITWHIPVAVLGALSFCYALAWLLNSLSHQATGITPLYGVFSGAAMLGAFFIATDPVSAATSLKGKILFGLGVGSITYFIREFGHYPEGIAFAVLLMNLAAPAIDHFCRPTPPLQRNRSK